MTGLDHLRRHPLAGAGSAHASDDRGSVLIVVLAVTGILALLVTVSFAVARRGIGVAAAEQDVHGSLAAAEAGLDDYLFRLNTVDEYWNYDDATPPPDGNTAFSPPTCPSVPADCNFVPIPGGEADGQFTYVVDTSRLARTGTIVLTSIGCSPGPCDADDPGFSGRVRAVEAQVRQRSFLEYLYFTDFETLAPLVYGNASDVQWAEDNCARRRWQQERPSGCLEIFWGENDRINGPFHTNDRFRLGGDATWTDTASNSDPRDPPYDANGHTPTFERGLTRQQPLDLPPSNAELFAEADYRINAEGCLFTGPTELTLNPSGTVTVNSPHTRRSGPGCGTWTDGVDAPQTIQIPDNGVIYVQGVPSSTSDDNHQPSRRGVGTNGLGYPYGNDSTTYSWRAGDAFVEGTLSGRLTIAAANDIVLTWHTQYADRGADMLGLIANDLVSVYHPRGDRIGCGDGRCYYENGDMGPRHPGQVPDDFRIDAAMLSVGNSVLVQNWDIGHRRSGGRVVCDPLGDLIVNGAIAQTFRGPVGTFNDSGTCTGYDKDYTYDQRLAFTNPPKFINPVEAQWVVSRYAEQF